MMLNRGLENESYLNPDSEGVVLEDWTGSEIYEHEEYFETDFGKVINEPDAIVDFLKEKGLLAEVMECFGILKGGC